MKKLFKNLLFLIPFVVIIMATNYIIDPGHLFKEGVYEKRIATFVTGNKYATNVTNYDGRLVQKYTIERLKFSPDIGVLSSSRGQFINSEIFPNEKLLNTWVQSASLEDFLAIYDIYEKNNLEVKKLILTLDPRLLNANSPRKLWKSISPNYYSMLSKLNIRHVDSTAGNSGNFFKYMQLISLSYFQYAIKAIIEKQTKVVPTTKRYNKGNTRAPDGSLIYGAAMRNASNMQNRQNAINFINSPVTLERNFDKIKFKEFSQNDLTTLIKFIDYLQKKKIEVIFFLSPYPPIVYNYFATNPDYKKVIESEQLYRNIAHVKRIRCIGSYDPKKYNLSESFFYDGIHCKESCVRLIFENEYPHTSKTFRVIN